MKTKKIVPSLIIILCSFCGSSFADETYNKAGTTSATFLKIGIGARATGMGEAACAMSDDANAIYWNPAGLGFLEDKELACMYNIWFEDIRHGFLGYAHPFKGFTLGGAINYLDAGKMEETTWDYPEGTDKTFGASDLAGYLTYARRLGGRLSVGVNLKYIQQRIENESATGYGADLGILYKPSKLKLGLAVQNIGTELKFIEEGYPLPLNIKVGAAYPLRNFLFALDANKPIDNEMNYSLGLESRWFKMLSLRAGYKMGADNRLSEHTGIATGWSAGVGFDFKILQLDAAYVPYGDLGDTYRVSLLTRFGGRDGEKEERGRTEKPGRPKEVAREIVQPLAPEVTDEGDYTRDKTRLYASWSEVRRQKSEDRKRVKEYQYAIGTTPGGTDVVDWRSTGIRTEVDATGLNLVDGKTYYISVKAKKKGLIFSKWLDFGSTDGIIVDSTSPDKPLITDDGAYTTNSKELHFTWSSSDQVSGIKEYQYALGTTPGGADIVNWTPAETKTESTLANLNLEDGKVYYLSVKAIDNAGNESVIGSSDGIMVDTTPPGLISITDEGKGDRLHFRFLFEDKVSGIAEYQYAIGTSPGGSDVVLWKPTTKVEIIETNLNLTNGKTYYFTVKAKNKAWPMEHPREF